MRKLFKSFTLTAVALYLTTLLIPGFVITGGVGSVIVATLVLAFLNIVGSGMKGGAIEQNLADMDPKLTAMTARKYRNSIVGIKLAHYSGPEWDPVDHMVKAGEIAEAAQMDKKAVDKAMKVLKADGRIVSPKFCYWTKA